MSSFPAPLRRSAIAFFLLLATIVFFVPSAQQHVASASSEVSSTVTYGPDVPVNRTTALQDAAHAPQPPTIYDASVAPPPGVRLPKVTSAAYAVVERKCGAMILGDHV